MNLVAGVDATIHAAGASATRRAGFPSFLFASICAPFPQSELSVGGTAAVAAATAAAACLCKRRKFILLFFYWSTPRTRSRRVLLQYHTGIWYQ